jgi:hypothetical protein
MSVSQENHTAEKMSMVYSCFKFLCFTGHLEACRNKSPEAPVHIRIKPDTHCLTHTKNLAIFEQLSLDPDHALIV